VSDTGKLVYLESPPSAASGDVTRRSLVWVHRDGTPQPIALPPGEYSSARISPDGERVVLVEGQTGERRPPDLWILERASGNLSRLTIDRVADAPVWSNDSQTIYFRSSPTASSTVYSIPAGGGEPTLISSGSSDFPIFFPSALTPDGGTLLLSYFSPASAANPASRGIVALGLGAQRDFQRALPETSSPALSRDGWMAYVESRDGAAPSLWIRKYSEVGGRAYPIAAGNYPAFSADGRELYFVAGDTLLAVSLEYDPAFSIVGEPRRVFSGPYTFRVSGRAWDVHPDGRFLVLRDAAANDNASSPRERQRIHIFVNWTEELQRRLAAE
jgi:hypothetical protein